MANRYRSALPGLISCAMALQFTGCTVLSPVTTHGDTGATRAALVSEAFVPAPGLAHALGNRAGPRVNMELAAIAAGFILPPVPPVSRPAPADHARALHHYLAGRDASLRGEYLAAILELQKAAALDPGEITIFRELARCYGAVRNMSRARVAFETMHRLDPMEPHAALTLATLAHDAGDYELTLRRLVPRILAGGSFSHDHNGDLVADIVLCDSLIQLGYDRAAIVAGQRVETSLQHAAAPGIRDPRIESAREELPSMQRSIADACFRQGDLGGAASRYEALGAEIGEPGHLARMLSMARAQQDPGASTRFLLQALEADAGHTPASLGAMIDYARGSGADMRLIEARLRHLRDAHPEDRQLARLAGATRGSVSDGPGTLRHVDAIDRIRTLAPGSNAEAMRIALMVPLFPVDASREVIMALLHRLDDPAILPTDLLGDARPEVVALNARILVVRGGLGAAWDWCTRGRGQWPHDRDLQRVQVEIAARLNEPFLLEDIFGSIDPPAGPEDHLLHAHACREVQDFTHALEHAEEAMEGFIAAGEDPAGASLELARTLALQADGMTVGPARTEQFRRASSWGEQARESPAYAEAATALLLRLYGEGGPLAEGRRWHRMVDALGRASRGMSPLFIRIRGEHEIGRSRPQDALEQLLRLHASGQAGKDDLNLLVFAWEQAGDERGLEHWLLAEQAHAPGDPRLLQVHTRFLLDRGRGEEAARRMEERLAAAPRDVMARLQLEHVLVMLGDPEGFEHAVARLERLPEGSRRRLQLGAIWIRAGDLSRAHAEFQWMVDHVDRIPTSHLTYAIGLLQSPGVDGAGQASMAVGMLERGALAGHDFPLSMYAIGARILARSSATSDLTERFDRLVELAIDRARGHADTGIVGILGWRNLAQQLIDVGNSEWAFRALDVRRQTAHLLDDDARRILHGMWMIASASRGDGGIPPLIDAVRLLDRRGELHLMPGLDEVVDVPEALLQLSQMCNILGNEAGSDRLLEEALRWDPDRVMAMNNLGYARLVTGRIDEETIALIERAAGSAPGDPAVVDTLAWLRFHQGRLGGEDGALALLEDVLGIDDEPSAEVLDHYADALWQSGDEEAALRTWEEVVRRVDDPVNQRQLLEQYHLYQANLWGLEFVSPRECFERSHGVVRKRALRKLQRARQGQVPFYPPVVIPSSVRPDTEGGGTGKLGKEKADGRTQ